MPKKRIPTVDEMNRVRAANDLLKPVGFKAYFFSKEGIKGAERPFRLCQAGRGDACVRYFSELDAMEAFAHRILSELEAVEKLNVLLKMWDIECMCKIVWDGNKARYRIFRSVSYGDRGLIEHISLRALESRVQMMIADAQRQQEAEVA